MAQNNVLDNYQKSERILRGKEVRVFAEEDADEMKKILSFDYMDVNLERPDFVLIYNNYDIIVGLEHFEFSSYKEDKKGNAFKRFGDINNRHHQKDVDDKSEYQKNDLEVYSNYYENKDEQSIEEYVYNFERTFERHYKKLNKYIKEIENNYNVKGKEIKIGFLIEDSTALGNRDIDNKTISLFNVKEIMEIVANAKEIDFIIYHSQYSNETIFISQKEARILFNYDDIRSKKDLEIKCMNTKEIKTSVVLKK